MQNHQSTTLMEVSDEELLLVSGSGFFYSLGAFFASVSNASDSIYDTYGNTNTNHW